MQDQEIKVIQALKEINKKASAGEHLTNVFKAVLSGVPTIGGLFTSLINDYIPDRKMERLVDFAEVVVEDIKNIADRLDNDYVKSDEFAYVFEECFRKVSENYQYEKIQAYRAILINSLLNPDMAAERKELYIKIVNDLLPTHILLLRAFRNPLEFCNRSGVNPLKVVTSTYEIFKKFFPELNENEIKSYIHDMDTLGLTNGVVTKDKFTIGPTTVELLAGRLTPLGKSLINFITMH